MPSEPSLLPQESMTEERYREGQRVTWVSVAVNLVLTVAQIGVGTVAHAQSLVADGFHSLSDLVADILVLMANHQSRHPADETHPYGHYRIETVASLALGLLLAGTGGAILFTAATRIQHLQDLPPVAALALWTALATLLAKEALFRYMLKVGEALRSPMLVANAWHARSDAASSLVAAAGIGGSLLGYRFLDPVAAIIVGFMILRMGAQFSYEAVMELIDTGVSDEEAGRIRLTIEQTPGVVDLHELRTRRMAHHVMVDAHVQVDPRISVSEGHRIAEMARARVLKAHIEVIDVLVHIDAEDDMDPGVRPIGLPDREGLLKHLESLLGESMPGLEETIFHYLGQKVEAEVFLPASMAADAHRMDRLRHRLSSRLETDSYFRTIHLNTRIAP